MDNKQKSNADNNITITAKTIIVENNIVVLYVCDLIALRGGLTRMDQSIDRTIDPRTSFLD